MLIHLKSAAKAMPQVVNISLEERMPAHIAPCTVNCQFKIEALDDYYILNLEVDAILSVTCQRCLNEFTYLYQNETKLAICRSEEVAEKIMEHYECLVSTDNHVDLKELLIDELYLYGPEFHRETVDCDKEMIQYISPDNTIKS